MTRALLSIITAAQVLTLTLGCSTTNSDADKRGRSPEMSLASGVRSDGFTQAGGVAAPASPARMIIRTGSIEVVVAAPEEAARQLTARVDELGGFVSDSTESDDSVRLSARVPSDRLDAFLDAAAALGEEENRSISGHDVTDSYADLQAEVDNLVSLRDRLRTLLDKARTVKEVLEVERELTRVQTRLDMLTSRMQRIEKDVALSNVDVYLSKEPERRVLGPLGLLYEGVKWVAVKLWVISP